MKVKANDIEFKIRCVKRWVATDVWKRGTGDQTNSFRVELERNGRTMRFTWHDSVSEFVKRHNSFTPEKAKESLECTIMDGLVFCQNNYTEFMNEFGYDDEREGLKCYNVCADIYDGLSELFTEDEIYEISDLISDDKIVIE